MSLKICSFASGSGGNCIYVGSETTSVLIDAGICVKRVKEGLHNLGVTPKEVSLLITHSHFDHISQIKRIANEFSPEIYAHYYTYGDVAAALPGYSKLREFDGDFYVGDITVSPFRLSHDVPCVGFSLLCKGKKVSVLTDTGVVTRENLEHIEGSSAVIIESNHDREMLMHNPRYTAVLKRRIMSEYGHLSNSDCACVVEACVRSGAKDIVLAHLSKENNTPELAYDTVFSALTKAGLSAKLCIAYQNKMSDIIEVSDEQ